MIPCARSRSCADTISRTGTTTSGAHVARVALTARYNVLVGKVRHLALRLSTLPAGDPYRAKHEAMLLNKLYDMGLLDTGAKMSDIMERLNVSAFCRRRLPIIMVRLHMSESVSQVCTGGDARSRAGGDVRGAGPCACRPRYHHRRSVPRDAEYGGLVRAACVTWLTCAA